MLTRLLLGEQGASPQLTSVEWRALGEVTGRQHEFLREGEL
jgi:hypothetical protein